MYPQSSAPGPSHASPSKPRRSIVPHLLQLVIDLSVNTGACYASDAGLVRMLADRIGRDVSDRRIRQGITALVDAGQIVREQGARGRQLRPVPLDPLPEPWFPARKFPQNEEKRKTETKRKKDRDNTQAENLCVLDLDLVGEHYPDLVPFLGDVQIGDRVGPYVIGPPRKSPEKPDDVPVVPPAPATAETHHSVPRVLTSEPSGAPKQEQVPVQTGIAESVAMLVARGVDVGTARELARDRSTTEIETHLVEFDRVPGQYGPGWLVKAVRKGWKHKSPTRPAPTSTPSSPAGPSPDLLRRRAAGIQQGDQDRRWRALPPDTQAALRAQAEALCDADQIDRSLITFPTIVLMKAKELMDKPPTA